MRFISETDKKLIKLITKITSYGFTLPELVESFIPEDCYVKIFEDPAASGKFELKAFRLFLGVPTDERRQLILSTLFNLKSSIDFLISENYITSVNDFKFESYEINQKNEKLYTVGFHFNDQTRYDLFSKFYYKYQATESLYELEKHNFSTPSEILSRKNFRLAVFALIISGVSALFAGYTIVNSNDFKKQINSNEIEIKGLKSILESLNNKKDTIILSPDKSAKKP